MSNAFLSLLRTRRAQATWLLLWAAVATALLVARLAPSGEPNAAPPSEDAPLTASIRFVRMTAAETTVEVTVAGREELPHLSGGAFAKLFDSAGAEHVIRTSSVDGRTLTVTFDGSAKVVPGLARIEFSRFGLTSDPRDVEPRDDQVTYVRLEPLVVTLVPTGGPPDRADRPASSTDSAGYGATVVSVVRDDESVVVAGHLDGFTREEIQSLDLRGTHLVLADGSERPFSGGTAGNGPELRDFAFQFNVPRSLPIARFELHISARVPPIVRAEASPDALARLNALEARGELVLVVALDP